MEEQLTCSVCQKSWNRIKTRGRKPLVCPNCISAGTTFIPTSTSTPSPTSESKSTTSNTSSVLSQLSVSKIHGMMHPKPPNHLDILESTKKGSTWKCPGCGAILTMMVGITATPTHRCTPDTVSVRLMERIS